IYGTAEIGIGIPIILTQRRCRHPELVRGLEILENLSPVALITRATPMTLVDNDEIEELGTVLAIQTWSTFVLGNGLIRREVHLAALDGLALNLQACVAERCELFVLRV